MLNCVYPMLKYGTLDEILREIQRCKSIIQRGQGDDPHPTCKRYVSTAEKYLALYEEEVIKRRAKGELTLQEELYNITGNVFTIVRAGG